MACITQYKTAAQQKTIMGFKDLSKKIILYVNN